MIGKVASMIGEVASLLKERGARLAVAESCTGGRLAAAFTSEAGASEYFLGGVVAYDNEVKIAVLGVGRDTLQRHGAVSREVAIEMARGVLRVTGADFALSTTGIAGPGGGSPEKPVGTVWIGIAAANRNADGDVVETADARKFRGCLNFATEGICDSDRGIFSHGDKGVGVPTAMETGENITGSETERPRAANSKQPLNFTGTRAEIMASAVEAAVGMLGEIL